jgi:hypothetical protein
MLNDSKIVKVLDELWDAFKKAVKKEKSKLITSK